MTPNGLRGTSALETATHAHCIQATHLGMRCLKMRWRIAILGNLCVWNHVSKAKIWQTWQVCVFNCRLHTMCMKCRKYPLPSAKEMIPCVVATMEARAATMWGPDILWVPPGIRHVQPELHACSPGEIARLRCGGCIYAGRPGEPLGC